MVSFFGLRFGSDKKKSQSKQSDKKQVVQQPQQTQRWNGNGNDSFKFPKPQAPASRPGTSTSNARNLGWRATFKGVPAASSMVDLSVPRKPSESSLRHGIDGAGFKPWMKPNASMTNLAVPDPFGVNGGGRPGMPSRPAGSRQSEWVNPLDVHFNKKPGSTSKSSNRAGSSGVQVAASKSPLSKPELKAEPEPEPEPKPAQRVSGGLDGFDDFGEPGPDVGIRGSGYAGYPSPPQSVETEDQWPPMAFAGGDTGAETDLEAEAEADMEAEEEVEASTHELQNHFAAPGFANGHGPAMLPSPSSSTSRKSEDKRASPVVRNVQAKRDTLTFLSPRRRSFTMAIEADDLEKHRQQQRPVEGLTGNFSNFDFGDGVTKQPAVAVGTLGLELVESPIQMKGPHPFREVVSTEEGDAEEAVGTQDAVSAEDVEDAASDGLTEPSETASLVSPVASPIDSPMASPMASPIASPRQYQVYHRGRESDEQGSPQRLKVAIPDEDSQSPSAHQPLPSPSAVSAGIESPRQVLRRPSQANIEAPVALASVLNSFTPSTPQGFNSRMASDSRARGPPQPLQHAALSSLIARMETPTHSPRSPYGPAADEDNYNAHGRRVSGHEGPSPRTTAPRPIIPPGESPERQSEERSPRPFSKWGGFGFDRSESRGATVPMPRTPKGQRPSSPSWSLSTPTSDVAPRIPSPTFPSLEKAISATSEDLAKSFEMSYDAPQPSPLANEFTIDDMPSPSIKPSPVIRVEAKKAPPRPTPSPINLPPSLTRDKGPLTPNSLYSPSGSTFI
ncbi:hypothetical protein TrVFT333_009195 [Trichoderma virens FT-333]|nr:hypothetical protein TrVFT333_009195 [Trichoderma virens FT-333]